MAGEDPGVITVVNIDDQREIREGLGVLIDATPGYKCVGRYRSMEEALAGIGPTAPDVALVDPACRAGRASTASRS
jgi:DNA-binding NarL/FixJ family response regulator